MELVKKKTNLDKLQELLDSFAEITGIKAAYFDNHSEEVRSKNMDSCAFCKSIREIPALQRCCWSSDDYGNSVAVETRKSYLYKCHIGLWEVVVPLYQHNTLLGFLMIGQVKGPDSVSNWEYIEHRLLEQYLPDERISQIKAEYEHLPEYNLQQVKATGKMLEMIAGYILSSDIFTVYESNLVERAKRYIEQNYQQEIVVKELAAYLGVSHSSLVTLFKKQMGITLTEYIEHLRITKAKELLLLTSQSIKQITYSCGYADQNYFSRVFKKNTGLSPRAFLLTYKNNC